MIKALFIAPTYSEAGYWAEQWGYSKDEWSFAVSTGDWRSKIFGFYEPDYPCYIVGSEGPESELWRELESRGFTVYDGQDIH